MNESFVLVDLLNIQPYWKLVFERQYSFVSDFRPLQDRTLTTREKPAAQIAAFDRSLSIVLECPSVYILIQRWSLVRASFSAVVFPSYYNLELLFLFIFA